MSSTLESLELRGDLKSELNDFFRIAAYYLIPGGTPPVFLECLLTRRWDQQLALEDLVARIKGGASPVDLDSPPLKELLQVDRAILVGVLNLLISTRRVDYSSLIRERILADAALIGQRYSQRTLLDSACSAGDLELVRLLLDCGAPVNYSDTFQRPPLYNLANGCGLEIGAAIVHLLVAHGAEIDHRYGVKKCTALHMAARRNSVGIARALLECGADPSIPDSRGDTALQRAINCRSREVAELLRPARRSG